jgi:hypothetical protein
MLEKVERLQSKVIRSAEIVRAAIGALGIVCLGIAILFRRKLKKLADGHLAPGAS